MKKAIIFDLDGTLVNSAAVCTRILNGMLRDRGSKRLISDCEAKPHLSRGGTAMVAALLADDCGEEHAEITEFRRRYSRLPTPSESLYPGVRAGLERLAERGITLAICSNKPQNLCEKVVDDLHLSSLFTAVIGGAPDRRPKPDRHLLDLTLAALKAPAEDCVFVGDSDLDEATAHAVGVPFYYVTYGYAPADWKPAQVGSYDRFSDLTAALQLACSPHAPLRHVA